MDSYINYITKIKLSDGKSRLLITTLPQGYKHPNEKIMLNILSNLENNGISENEIQRISTETAEMFLTE